ncbi:hypothetical protein BASA81_002284 [Batrachochytrium salamandrivorans]|nr:hypothetical protein BASA81_002284 [Batrachochytrium salamandrivorans]
MEEKEDEVRKPFFPNEKEASSRVALETRISLEQIQGALREVEDFNLNHCTERELGTSLRGFALMESNLRQLLDKANLLQQWHYDKHHTRQTPGQTKELLLAEISILLVTPYIHRLLTTEDRKHPGGLFDSELDVELSSDRLRLKQLGFEHIDPVYATQYDGVCLASLMRSVKLDRKHSFWDACCGWGGRGKRPAVSLSHQAHAQVLASKFFGVITCIEMILLLGPHSPEADLILERAVGYPSELEIPGTVKKLVLYDRATAKANLASFTSLILTANAVVDAGYDKSFLLVRLAHYAATGMRLVLPWNKHEAELRGELCYCGTKQELLGKLHFARFVWNLPETPLVKLFYRLGLERIRVDYEFYIPPNPKYLGGQDPVFARVIANHSLVKYPSTTSIDKALRWRPRALNNLFSPSRPLLSDFPTPTIGVASAAGEEPPSGKNVLLVHFHGGGFIALSSFSHENYTRVWARDMPGVTVVSVDYRLAPDFKFPYAFNDAYRAYRHVVETCEESFGFVPRKVLVAGDSAGGNLACAVCVQAIKDKFRVPDGVLLIYPVVDMQRTFSPSLLKSVNDRIVPFVFLECCMSAYLGDEEEAKLVTRDTRCSPALAEDEVLCKMPPTRIVVGDCDPLMDQSIRFAHHLARLGVDVDCKLFEGMPHGFCSFIWPVVGVPEVKACVDECTVILKQLAGLEDQYQV